MIRSQIISIPGYRNGLQSIDFGKDAYGYLEVELTGKGGEEIELAIGEVVKNGRLNRNPGGYRCFKKMNLALKKGTHRYRFEIPEHVAPAPWLPKCYPPAEAGGEIAPFRYLEINGYSGPVKAERHAVFAPFDDNAAHFHCSDEELNRIWEFCKYSIKATTAFGMYIDGERERLPYEGDTYINQLGHFCCDASYDIAGRTIEHFFDHPTWPTEWRLLTPILVRDYLLYSGDTDSVTRWLPKLKEKLLLDHAGDDLLIRGTSEIRDIVDWPEKERDSYEFGEVNLVPNCYHYGALLVMHELSGDPFYLERAAAVRKAIRTLMLKNGMFVDNPDSNHTSLHSAMFAIRFDVADPAEYPALVSLIRAKGMACSVYGAQFLLEACYRCGLADHALHLMTAGVPHALEGVVLAAEPDGGPSVTLFPDGAKGGRQPGDPVFHLEPLFFQEARQGGSGTELPVSKLGLVENVVGDPDELRFPRRNILQNFLFKHLVTSLGAGIRLSRGRLTWGRSGSAGR